LTAQEKRWREWPPLPWRPLSPKGFKWSPSSRCPKPGVQKVVSPAGCDRHMAGTPISQNPKQGKTSGPNHAWGHGYPNRVREPTGQSRMGARKNEPPERCDPWVDAFSMERAKAFMVRGIQIGRASCRERV